MLELFASTIHKTQKDMSFWLLIGKHAGHDLRLRLVCRDAAYWIGGERRIKYFKRQKEAQTTCRRDLGHRVWARDLPDNFKIYGQCSQEAAHAFVTEEPNRDLYEILEEPEALPANLLFKVQASVYLDCEYDRTCNPSALPDDELMDLTIASLTTFARRLIPQVARVDAVRYAAHTERKF